MTVQKLSPIIKNLMEMKNFSLTFSKKQDKCKMDPGYSNLSQQ